MHDTAPHPPAPLHPARSYQKLAQDVRPGSVILVADGAISLEVGRAELGDEEREKRERRRASCCLPLQHCATPTQSVYCRAFFPAQHMVCVQFLLVPALLRARVPKRGGEVPGRAARPRWLAEPAPGEQGAHSGAETRK